MPLLAWIALAPIMLIADAHLTVLQYALWQVPVFGAAIVGNWVLHYMTHRHQARKILKIGSMVSLGGLLTILVLNLVLGNYFVWLIPGIIIYFFGLGITIGPLNRIILFSTPVAKGTASALMTLIAMFIQALGLEAANFLVTHNNRLFSEFCFGAGLIYAVLLICAFSFHKQIIKPRDN